MTQIAIKAAESQLRKLASQPLTPESLAKAAELRQAADAAIAADPTLGADEVGEAIVKSILASGGSRDLLQKLMVRRG